MRTVNPAESGSLSRTHYGLGIWTCSMYAAKAVSCSFVSLSRNEGMFAPPFITWVTISSFEG